MTDKQQPAQFDWATELSDVQGRVTLSEQEAHEIGARLRRLHAYCQELESQVIRDCMTHVQNPAEIEHDAGDVSKNGAEVNMPELAHEIFALAQLAPGEGIEDAVARIAAALRTQHPAPAGATYKDSTPQLNVGDSAFESWYATYNPAHKADKQRARDAYAAGMGDPLVIAAPTAQPAPATQQAVEPVYAFRRKGLADFCTCDEARYEELSNKPHLFETRIFYTAPQPVAREPLTDEQREAIWQECRYDNGGWEVDCWEVIDAVERMHSIKGGQHGTE